jgi:hypothetical protein
MADALQNNTVSHVSPHPSYFHHLHSKQTLTTLNLWCNQIGIEGAQYLGNALQSNTVSPDTYSPILYFHGPHSK